MLHLAAIITLITVSLCVKSGRLLEHPYHHNHATRQRVNELTKRNHALQSEVLKKNELITKENDIIGELEEISAHQANLISILRDFDDFEMEPKLYIAAKPRDIGNKRLGVHCNDCFPQSAYLLGFVDKGIAENLAKAHPDGFDNGAIEAAVKKHGNFKSVKVEAIYRASEHQDRDKLAALQAAIRNVMKKLKRDEATFLGYDRADKSGHVLVLAKANNDNPQILDAQAKEWIAGENTIAKKLMEDGAVIVEKIMIEK